MGARHLGFAIVVFGLLWFGMGWLIQFGELGRIDPVSSIAFTGLLVVAAIGLFRAGKKGADKTVMSNTPKRGYDLRDFWPWYARRWPTKGGSAEPPPFRLSDIHPSEVPAHGWTFFQVLTLVGAAILIGLTAWAVFLM